MRLVDQVVIELDRLRKEGNNWLYLCATQRSEHGHSGDVLCGDAVDGSVSRFKGNDIGQGHKTRAARMQLDQGLLRQLVVYKCANCGYPVANGAVAGVSGTSW